jgi:hypothetical protein
MMMINVLLCAGLSENPYDDGRFHSSRGFGTNSEGHGPQGDPWDLPRHAFPSLLEGGMALRAMGDGTPKRHGPSRLRA